MVWKSWKININSVDINEIISITLTHKHKSNCGWILFLNGFVLNVKWCENLYLDSKNKKTVIKKVL